MKRTNTHRPAVLALRVQSPRWAGVVLVAGLSLLAVALLHHVPTLNHDSRFSGLELPFAVALGTLVSEDLACVSAAQLIGEGRLGMGVGIGACLLGIVGGDLGLWLLGRVFAKQFREMPWLRARMEQFSLDRILNGVHRWPLLVGARFTPGLRLPVYVLAGATQVPLKRFALIVLSANLIWVPVIVLAMVYIGQALTTQLEGLVGIAVVSVLLVVLCGLIVLRAAQRVIAALSPQPGRKVGAWEFWPAWAFYVPVFAWLLLRNGPRRLLRVTAANPGIPLSGIRGESKSQILRALGPSKVLPFKLIHSGTIDLRLATLDAFMFKHATDWPVILKPDIGQRGQGVSVIRSASDAREYFQKHPQDVIAQIFHPGPFEAGIFYVRLPDEPAGRIFSLTEKVFPFVTGDGTSSLEQLIAADARYSKQRRLFAARHAVTLQRVFASGERVGLTDIGNHCQGTEFRDGCHLITPELTRAVDAIAQTFRGFYFGRFDARYTDVERFRAGDDIAIVEVNGLTSEATHIYDPSSSPLHACATLARQWQIAIQIAEQNVRRGASPARLGELLGLLRPRSSPIHAHAIESDTPVATSACRPVRDTVG